jgi:hypothetical protein
MGAVPEMIDFVKAIAHTDRLKIVGMLVRKPATLAEIAKELSLPSRDAFNHLEFLKFVEVVREVSGKFQLDDDGLEKIASRQFQGKRSSFSPPDGLEPDRKKVLGAFLNPDGTIRQIPNSRTQGTKYRIVLEYVLAAFEPDVNYTEKQVNQIILRFNEDFAGLRRDLVDAKMMARERDGSMYWRVGDEVVNE